MEAPRGDAEEAPQAVEKRPDEAAARAGNLSFALERPLQAPGVANGAAKMSSVLREAARSVEARDLDGLRRDSRVSWRDDGRSLVVDISFDGEASALEAELFALGAREVTVYGRLASAVVPVTAIRELGQLESVRFARAVHPPILNAGSVTSQTSLAVRADDARTSFGVDGSGTTIGLISDSFDCLGGAAADVASGDLPTVTVVEERASCAGATDEGRAMAQLIHDVAPGAELLFHSGSNGGQAGLASAIVELETLGADIIVDDLQFLTEPMFQDGVIAQAVETVSSLGAVYFSAAGDAGRESYESPFRPSGRTVFGEGEAHDFDPSAEVGLFQTITIPVGATLVVTMQWNSPFASVSGTGTQTDMDIFLTDDPVTIGLASSVDANINGDPVEVLSFQNDGTRGTSFNIVIERYRGPEPSLIKYVINQGGTVVDLDTDSGTIYGHANAESAFAVGAAAYIDTPEFGTTPPVLESFSSAGGTPILFDTAGNPVNLDRGKPEFVAADGGNNTFFGTDFEPDGSPNFFGTSAAVADAAAVGALMLERTPGMTREEARDALQSTAIDMAAAGIDADTGAGLIDAEAAVSAVTRAPSPVNVTTGTADGAYSVGTVIDIDVIFDQAVNLDTGSGTPSLLLETGTTDRVATFLGANSTTWSFRYTVQAGDETGALDAAALSLNGATAVAVTSGLDADTDLPAPGAEGSLSDNRAIVIDTLAPSIVSVAVPAADTYAAGDTLDFTVNASEAVNLGGSPTLNLDIGGQTRQAALASGNGTSALVFSYTVQSGEADSNGVAVASLGATGSDAAGNSLDPTLAGVADTSGVRIDGVAPTVVSVVVPAGGTYGIGSALDFVVNATEILTVPGTPELVLQIGSNTRQATFTSGDSSSGLAFRYVVQAGDLDANGIVVSALTGVATDAAGNNINPALNGVGDTSAVLVDGVVPTVTGVVVPAPGAYVVGETLAFTANFGEPVTTADATLRVNIGGALRDATLTGGSGTAALTFEYVVQVDDSDADGIALASLTGSVNDLAGNPLNPTLNGVGDTSMVRVDGVVPRVVSVTSPADDGIYEAGATIAIDVVFSEAVFVTGTAELVLETGATDTTVQDDGTGSGTDTLRFLYTVRASHQSPDLDYVSSDSLTGTIVDASGNAAILTLAAPGQPGSLGANKALVISEPQAEAQAAIRVDTDTIDEDGGIAVITATLSAASTETVAVSLEYAGTAARGLDYEVDMSATIQIPAGARTASTSVVIAAIDDEEVEPSETIIVSIDTVTGGATASTGTQTITIVDDDVPDTTGGDGDTTGSDDGDGSGGSSSGCSVQGGDQGAGSAALLILVGLFASRRRRRAGR